MTYSPGWIHPMFYYDAIVWIAVIVLIAIGAKLRRGVRQSFKEFHHFDLSS